MFVFDPNSIPLMLNDKQYHILQTLTMYVLIQNNRQDGHADQSNRH